MVSYHDESGAPAFGNGRKTRTPGFCGKAAWCLLLFLPIAVTLSNSAIVAMTYSMAVFWIFGGNWRERFAIVKSSSILLASLPLILWTFLGIFRCADTFEAAEYWVGHYPYFFIVIFATLLVDKARRYAILSVMNIAMMFCFLWMVGFCWRYSDLDIVQWNIKRYESIYLFKNTICFGMAVTLWGGMWLCFPFTSRSIPGVRRFLPTPLLRAMEQACAVPFYNVPLLFFSARREALTILLAALRWGIVVFAFVFVCFLNPSRTALIGTVFAYAVVLLRWNVKRSLLIGLCVLGLAAAALFVFGDRINVNFYRQISPEKHQKESAEWDNVQRLMKGQISQEELLKTEITRPGTYMLIINEILEKPFFGVGMEEGCQIVFDRTGYVDPHNEFLYIALLHGIVGLAFFLFWLMSLFVPTFRNNGPWQRFGLFVATLVFFDCLFNNAMSYHRETFLLCIAIALSAVSEHDAPRDERTDMIESSTFPAPVIEPIPGKTAEIGR